MEHNNKSADGQKSRDKIENESLKDQSVLVLTIIGTLIILLGFYILYRGERIINKQWTVKNAKLINPNKPGSASGMVKFTGTPGGDLIVEELTKEQFVYLNRSLYEYKKVKKIITQTITKDGRKKHITKEVYENKWVFISSETKRAEDLRIGEINIRVKEAEVIGKNDWRKSIYITKTKRSYEKPENPVPGDRRFIISGINARNPMFAVGNLSNKYLGMGKLFIISAYSQGKTIEELKEFFVWRWMRHPACFAILFVGFIFLIHPAMVLLRKKSDVPVLGALSKSGWTLFIIMSFLLSLVIVVFSSVTVDIIWIILLIIVIAPIITYFKKKKPSS
ncbi:hypothetical protein ACFL20_09325 [Spirochaetota bacterium]